MKKILAICLMVVIVLSMSVMSVFAAPGAFLKSPSGNSAPTKVEFDPKDEECTAELIITPYSDRKTLQAELKTLIEKAYDVIANTDDLTTLNADLKDVAASKKIPGDKLAVSDLFNMHVVGCNYHDDHVDFDITLAADTLSRFVGLIYMNKNGEWELVSNAKVTKNGEHLEFSMDEFSPFAIVIDTSKGTPQTGDNSLIYVYAVIMALSALGIIIIAVKSKKQKA
jgi:hypothetical protein